ncbi:MAG: hypothetical protein LBU82_08305, partial [Treponema sp.]|nr:hypothetical protein [Treponema sp.]
MRIPINSAAGQALLFIVLLPVCACSAKTAEDPVVPPVTSPLSRDYIGYGVITASFTHYKEEPSDASATMGYLRRGSLVKIVKRQWIKSGNVPLTWVLTEGKQQGWLKEKDMEIYDS